MMRPLLVAIPLLLSSGMASAQILREAQLNAKQIRALDKQRTVVILTGGILEEHGPHLPSFADGYSNEWLSQKLAEGIVARAGWTALMFPTIPLGHAGANEIGGQYVFPGTYSVRRTTLRAVFMDLATELGDQGFGWIFVVHGHGAPYHSLMLDQACDYFRDTYGGRMVHLRGLEPTPKQLTRLGVTPPTPSLSDAESRENGVLDVHAGYEETSRLLFLRPDLVNMAYRTLRPCPANSSAELYEVGRAPDWPGYIGSPRLAPASDGARLQEYRAKRDIALALAILDGLDEREVPRYARAMLRDKVLVSALEGATKHEVETERKQREWMKRKGIR